ncbi:MAG: VIT family protein [Acidobacteriota bacterium]
MAEHMHGFGQHRERHRTDRIGWLRAAVLGANDGIVSTASLIVGVAAAASGKPAVLIAGLAGLVAGAMSMAAGEYVSVHSQADTEKADLAKEKRELAADHEGESMELAGIYVERGLDPKLAREVADQLMAHDALGAHARDELGITIEGSARPMQAAVFSAVSFALGAGIPLAAAVVIPYRMIVPTVMILSLILLAFLGGLAARAGGASIVVGAVRVTFWGLIAMIVTSLVGYLVGATV